MKAAALVAAVVTAAAMIFPAGSWAHTTVTVPEGTQVPLTFLSTVDSVTAQEGQQLRFRVAANVLVNRRMVIRQGAAARGTIASVSPPGIFGQNARVHVAFIQVTAIDGRSVRLSPIDITPESLREARDTGGAAASSAAGLVLLGPIGLAAGALVRGGHVKVPAGAVGISVFPRAVRVTVP